MRIAILSDIHIDVNKEYNVTKNITNYLKEYQCKTIVIAGDISSHYDTTIDVVNKFTKAGIQALFVSGNHDIYTNSKYPDSLETYRKYCEHPNCLSGSILEIGNSVILGDTGWYDYSFRDPFKYTWQQTEMKNGWMDKYRINFDDLEFCAYQNKKFKSRLDKIVEDYEKDKRIIIVSHMVPCIELCRQYPDTYYDAFTGSQELWNIVQDYNVSAWIYGHNHVNREMSLNGIYTMNASLNYNGEWNGRNINEQIEYAVKFIEV